MARQDFIGTPMCDRWNQVFSKPVVIRPASIPGAKPSSRETRNSPAPSSPKKNALAMGVSQYRWNR